MFGINDIPKFFLAFFLVLPVISFLHEAGHVFFAWLMGAKNIKVTVGTGRVLFRWGLLEVRQYYFWYGLCTFDNLKRRHRLANILIFSGGALFNAISAIAVIYMVEQKLVTPNLFTYQFTYFSLYYIFFALLPMPYPDGNNSDGKTILDLAQSKKTNAEFVIRIQWQEEQQNWCVIDQEGNALQAYQAQEEALERARNVAQQHRPSKLVQCKNGEETEIQNYPRVPL